MAHIISRKDFNLEEDGITQGLLSNWVDCHQRALHWLRRLTRRDDEESLPMAFGNAAHKVLEWLYAEKRKPGKIPSAAHIHKLNQRWLDTWHADNPRASAKLIERVEACAAFLDGVIPAYVAHWSDDFTKRRWIGVEHEFSIPYTTADGRKTRIRGVVDGVFLEKRIAWLLETKTKSWVDQEFLVRWLPMDLQTNIYLWAVRQLIPERKVAGVVYNLIRRPALRQKKDETLRQFAQRCAEDVLARPDWYFLRLEVKFTIKELKAFAVRLARIVEEFCDWLDGKVPNFPNPSACRQFNRPCWALDACAGEMDKYKRRKKLYRELSS